MLADILADVEYEATLRNWEVVLKVIEAVSRLKKLKPGRSRRHRLRLLKEDPFCNYCGLGLDLDTSTIDHILPLCRGGTWDRKNLVLACEKCNRDKGSSTLYKGRMAERQTR